MNFTSEESLNEYLQKRGISTSTWGKGATKTVAQLFKELQNGECSFIEPENNKCCIRMHVVNVDVFYKDESGNKFYLIEERQVFKNNSERKRTWLPTSLAEKMKPKETPEEATKRCLQEELGIIGTLDMKYEKAQEEFVPSSATYPGVSVKRTAHVFTLYLTKNQFKPEGYIETQPDKTTYFTWKKMKY